jgi:hypothetical protein
MSNLKRKEIKKIFGMEVLEDQAMERAMDVWDNIYLNSPPWMNSPVFSTYGVPLHMLSLGPAIANKYARMVMLELTSKIHAAKSGANSGIENLEESRSTDDSSEMEGNPATAGNSPREEQSSPDDGVPLAHEEDNLSPLDEQYQQFLSMLRPMFGYALALGGCVFKPYRANDGKLYVSTIPANQFYPISFEPDGTMTGAVLAQDMQRGNKIYTLLELHMFSRGSTVTNEIDTEEDTTNQSSNGEKLAANAGQGGASSESVPRKTKGTGTETISYRAYYVEADLLGYQNTIGTEIELNEVPEWAYLSPEVTVRNLPRPLFEYFKCPFVNNINPVSPLGVSVYAAAVGLLQDADIQYSLYLTEYLLGKFQIGVPADSFRKDSQGHYVMPDELRNRLYVPQETLTEWQPWAPTLRDESLYRGLDNILRKIEFACGLSYNTLSDANQKELTATEVMSSKQDSHTTKHELQTALEQSLTHVAEIMSVMENMPFEETDVTFDWDDSIIPDIEVEKNIFMREVAAGLRQPWEYRVKFCDETEEEAKRMTESEETNEEDTFFGDGERNDEGDKGINKEEVDETEDDAKNNLENSAEGAEKKKQKNKKEAAKGEK